MKVSVSWLKVGYNIEILSFDFRITITSQIMEVYDNVTARGQHALLQWEMAACPLQMAFCGRRRMEFSLPLNFAVTVRELGIGEAASPILYIKPDDSLTGCTGYLQLLPRLVA